MDVEEIAEKLAYIVGDIRRFKQSDDFCEYYYPSAPPRCRDCRSFGFDSCEEGIKANIIMRLLEIIKEAGYMSTENQLICPIRGKEVTCNTCALGLCIDKKNCLWTCSIAELSRCVANNPNYSINGTVFDNLGRPFE